MEEEAMTEVEHGVVLALRFLAMCRDDSATGTALLNAMGNAVVMFFLETPFDSHRDRMTELDGWCASLKREIEEAHQRAMRDLQ